MLIIGPSKPFFSQSSPVHSPKLIFHIINMSQDPSVSLSVIWTLLTWFWVGSSNHWWQFGLMAGRTGYIISPQYRRIIHWWTPYSSMRSPWHRTLGPASRPRPGFRGPLPILGMKWNWTRYRFSSNQRRIPSFRPRSRPR